MGISPVGRALRSAYAFSLGSGVAPEYSEALCMVCHASSEGKDAPGCACKGRDRDNPVADTTIANTIFTALFIVGDVDVASLHSLRRTGSFVIVRFCYIVFMSLQGRDSTRPAISFLFIGK
jgi:hypothetical protein